MNINETPSAQPHCIECESKSEHIRQTLSDSNCQPSSFDESTDDTTPPLNSDYFFYYAQAKIEPSLFERDEFEKQFPAIVDMLYFEDDGNDCTPVRERPRGMVFAQKNFPSLFFDEMTCPVATGAALMFSLPSQYESNAGSLAAYAPDIYNETSTDLMDCWTVFSWTSFTEKQTLTVGIPESAALRAIFFQRNNDTINQLMVIFVPVIVLSGNTVALGGFWYDTRYSFEHQGASVTSANHQPYRIFSEDELESAKKLAALKNNKDEPKVLDIVDGRHEIGLKIIDYTVSQHFSTQRE